MNMKQAMRDFEAHLAVERNLSPYTRKSYLIDLRQFRDFLGNSDVSEEAMMKRFCRSIIS